MAWQQQQQQQMGGRPGMGGGGWGGPPPPPSMGGPGMQSGGYGGRPQPGGYGGGPGGPGGYGGPPPPGPSGPGGYGYQGGPPQHGGPPPPGPGGPGGAGQMINCPGCQSPTVSNLIKGTFAPSGESNHGKPVFKKVGGDPNVSVFLYFWDERDGPNFNGWWFAPKVGGDQVWAFHPNKNSPMPPPAGWKVPWDGPEDPILRLTPAGGAPSQGGPPQQGGPQMGMRPPMPGPGGMVPPSQRGPMGGQHDWQQEEQRRREAAERERAQVEERRRREEDRQRAMMEQQKRRQEEEERRRKQMEEDRRRREEERQRREAEAQRKREEEEVRRKEQAAALAVRKVIQRVRIATPETYDNLRAELEEAQQKHLEDMGSQADRVSQEAQQTLEQTQRRIDDMIKKREEDERRRVEEEQRKKEEAEKVERLMQEMKEEVEQIQEKITEGEEKGKELQALGAEATSEEIVAAAEAAQKTAEEVKEILTKTDEALTAKHEEMGRNDASWGVKREVNDLFHKVTTGKRAMDAVISSANWAKEKAVRKAAAMAQMEELKTEFSAHDKDKDGTLSKAEVMAFSKARFEFDLPGEVLERIMKSLAPIGVEKYRALFQKVAIARSEERARAIRAEEEKKRKELEEKKAAVQKIVQEASEVLSQAEGTCSKAEADARILARGDSDLSAEKLTSLADDVQKTLALAKEQLEQAVEKTKEVETACEGEEELQGLKKAQMPRLEQRAKRVEERAEKVAGAAETAKELAVKRAYTEIDKKRSEAATAIRAKMVEVGKSAADFFKEAAGDKTALDKEKFEAVLASLGDGLQLAEGEGDKLFVHIAGEAEEVSEDAFLQLTRLFYKVVKGTVLSEDIAIKSKPVRKLELSEVLEALEHPSKEEAVGVERVKCRAVNDDAVGYVTLAGNQGTPFLTPGGNIFTCVKETVLTDGLSVQDSKTVRRVQKDEVLEVLEFAKKDKDLDLTRVRAMAKSDGATGWITMCGNQGTNYLEVC